MTTHKSIFYQAQEQVCEALNEDEVLSGKVTFISENSKDIDYELKNALGRQGIVGIVMTPDATYQGITSKGEQVWDLKNFTVQVVENPIVNRGQPKYANITALDAAARATEVLADPRFGLFGQYCPVTIEQGEDSGLIVAQAKFDVQIKSEKSDPYTYIYFDDGTTSKVLWEGEVTHQMGEDAGLSDTSPTARIVFGPAVTSLADECFAGLPVTEALFKSGLLSIGRRAFAFSSMITKVELPNTVQSIAEEAFLDDQNIEVTFQGRTKAEVQAMENYSWGLQNGRVIHCSDGDIVVGETVVTYTNGSTSQLNIEGQLNYDSIPNIVNLTSVEIGSAVTSLGNWAFSGCYGLTSVTIPESVTSIGQGVFAGCRGLTSVTIPDNVRSIGREAFEGCIGLTSVTIGNSVTSIGSYAFNGCSGLTSVTIPDSVTSIGYYAFEGCSGLTSVTFSNKDKATVQGMANHYWDLPSGCKIHCTDGDITI